MKIKDLRKVTNFKFLNMFELDYVDMKGQDKSWQFTSREEEPKCTTGQFDIPDAVVIVPYHLSKQRIVIIKEFRVPLNDYQYGFPAGLVDDGENINQAALRELKEETGLKLDKVLKVSPPIYSTSGMTDESISMVYAECSGEPSTDHNESSEDIEVMLLDQAQARELLTEPTNKLDVKTWIVLSRFVETGTV